MMTQHKDRAFKIVFAAILMWLAALALALLTPTRARDSGQWENSDPAVREWYKGLKMPDSPTVSCCGEADAYWCDDIHVRDTKTYCNVTDDRDDKPLGRGHIPVGTELYIPNHKLKWTDGNPTGHAIAFVAQGDKQTVLCFVQNGGI